MKLLPMNELRPNKIYTSSVTTKLLIPREKEFIENVEYRITLDESFFVLPLVGNAIITLNNTKIHLAPGCLIYVPPNQDVIYTESADFEYLRVQFIIKDIKTDEPIIFSEHPTLLLENVTEEIKGIMYEIHSYCPAHTSALALRSTSAFYKLLAIISDSLYSSRSTAEIMPKIYTVIKYMKNNFMRNDTTKFLADMVNLSEPYFRKCFKKTTNMTPIEYRNYLRIEEAKKIITYNDKYNTSDFVAHHSGFDDTHYFQKLFKKYTGVTPRQYFKMHFSTELPNEKDEST